MALLDLQGMQTADALNSKHQSVLSELSLLLCPD